MRELDISWLRAPSGAFCHCLLKGCIGGLVGAVCLVIILGWALAASDSFVVALMWPWLLPPRDVVAALEDVLCLTRMSWLHHCLHARLNYH